MRLLVLGASGMLGHKLVQRLGERFDVVGSLRGPVSAYTEFSALDGRKLVGGVDVRSDDAIASVIEEHRADAVINAVGVIKQRREADDAVESIEINSLLPHRLARITGDRGVRLVHFSTDCVFSGSRGGYTEDDTPDARDLYGRSKLLGEVGGPGCLTVRSSIVGRELRGGLGLFEWFFSQAGGKARGFTNAIYTGLTTIAMSDLVGDLLADHPDLSGVWQVASEPIDKHRLLSMVNEVFSLGVQLTPDDSFRCDRSLDGGRFREQTGYVAPSWDEMIDTMRRDPTPYRSH